MTIDVKSYKEIANNIVKLKTLYEISQDNNRSLRERIDAVKVLKTEYKDAFANYTDEQIALGKATSAYNELTNSLLLQAEAKAYLNRITELYQARIDAEATRDQLQAEYDIKKAEEEMGAWHATFLCAQKRLVKGKQNFIQFINIVISVHKEILHDHIEFIAVRKGKARTADKILCLIDIQFQSKSESQSCCLGWFIVHIVSDL